MNPDDPRHATYAGYIAGCRCQPCSRAKRLADTERITYRLHHGTCRATRADVEAFLDPWLRMGISRSTIAQAVGLNPVATNNDGPVNRSTWARLRTFTENLLPDTAKVYADLTRTRIYSLMAAGHQLKDMPINSGGKWRQREHLTVGQARAIRTHFEAHQLDVGPALHTANRAKNAGHVPPLAWDDPGTLAWPNGTPRRLPGLVSKWTPRDHDIDELAVQRVLDGEVLPLTKPERDEAMRRWVANGGSRRALCTRMGWKEGRYGTDPPPDQLAS